MTRERLGLTAVLVLLGAGWRVTQPLAKIAVSGGYRHVLLLWQLAIGTAILLSASINAPVYTTYVWLVGRAGAVFAVQVSYLVTGCGVLWSMTILGERDGSGFWLAPGLMFMGLFLVQPRAKAPLADPDSARHDVVRTSASRPDSTTRTADRRPDP